ncbi:Hpt domain-containing protein [Duganella sp. CF402]|uniref:Hpt domain-containing protein n=1 Tax=unclassified Duganella TaxID=2636909 RepID=UPI0008CE0934|nr:MULTISPECIES: Hpt domain-containing protein [unclassified Duganella]RZT10441.1 Hpt domain-containing protein [Duganella sp. BK701]SEL13005.1 Hpt domain-containing protein [Duganella sp. CF402]
MTEVSPSPAEETIFSVDTLIKYMGNDDKALAVVAKIVRDACAPRMAPFELAGAALREQRLTEAGKIFHSLRGSIGTLGAKRLVSASLKLEKAIAEQSQEAIPALFAALESEYQLVLRDAEAWLQRNAPQAG